MGLPELSSLPEHEDSILQVEETSEILAIIKKVVDSDGKAASTCYDRWKAIMYKYQEQSELLDAILEAIITPLSCLLRKLSVTGSLTSGDQLRNMLQTCRLLHVLVIVRGYKTVVKFFQHEASDLEKVLSALLVVKAHKAETSDVGCVSWEAQQILLLWLSMLILTPFALATVDSETQGAEAPYTALVGKVMGLCKEYLYSPGGMREMAALLLGRLLTRPDMGPALKEFLEWVPVALKEMGDDISAAFLVPGVIQTLAHIFKLGSRAALLQFAPPVWSLLSDMIAADSFKNKALAHKLAIKLAQRLALTFMEPRLAPWRYVKDDVDLDAALDVKGVLGGEDAAAEGDEDGEDFEVAEEIEEVIECVLGALKDKDTIVRWSAAKGVGRITSCLPKELGDEVVGHVLQLFRPTESDTAWHGGCLALAELARRGLLLPDRLPIVVPIVQQGLQYDVRRGPHSIGAHVRDAAAYVCWACARAYAPEVLEGSVPVLAAGLLSVACYDREVNCRRAAAAAFQEAVGRLGNFPHGMEILAVADFFTVGNITQAYMQVGPQVCAFPQYRVTLTSHLLSKKLRHWEKSMRELAARAAAALVGVHAEYMATDAIEELLPLCTDAVLEVRHGAVLGFAELLTALHAFGQPVSPELLSKIADVTPAIDMARLYRGKGGEIMREAVSKLIGSMASVGLTMNKTQHGKVLEALDENLRHPQQFIQASAAEAIGLYAKAYLTSDQEIAAFGAKQLEAYTTRLHDPNVAVRRGYAGALGSLPAPLIRPFAKQVVDGLVDGAHPEEDVDGRDVESRVACLRALTRVCTTLCTDGLGHGSDGELLVKQVIPCVTGALADYTTDNRGDVGSTVREAAMKLLSVLLPLLAETPAFTEARKEELLCGIMTTAAGQLLKQGVERIARTREMAIRHLQSLLACPGVAVRIQAADAVRNAMPNVMELTGVASLDAAECHKWIPHIVCTLLLVPVYTTSILEGLVASVGGLDNSLAKVASAALVDAINKGQAAAPAKSETETKAGTSSTSVADSISSTLIEIWGRHAKTVRMSTPLLRTAKLLAAKTSVLSAQVSVPKPPEVAETAPATATSPAPEPNASETSSDTTTELAAMVVVKLVRAEMRACGDVIRLMDVSAALCQLLAHPNPCHTSALQGLLLLLVNRYPKVRRHSAEQMYLQLLVLEPHEQGGPDAEVTEKEAEEAQDLVLTSNWDGEVEGAREARDQLAQLLHVSVPATKAKAGGNGTKSKVRDENESYSSLIEDFARFKEF